MLDMHEPAKDGRRHYEASGIFSPDGEYLPYATPVVLDGRPEDWLNLVSHTTFIPDLILCFE